MDTPRGAQDRPYRLARRDAVPTGTVVSVGDVRIGGAEVVVMAGPCAVETAEQTRAAARAVRAAGVRILRGGVFKPRTSPYSFQGLGPEGLEILSAAARAEGLAVVTEVLSPADAPLVARHADILQIGSRSMANTALLVAAAATGKPILLKRGMAATLEELLMAAEYILAAGNPGVILCERGIRTFERATRNTLDVTAVPALKALTHLPVIVDPSHATGDRRLVPPAALAAVAAGADGLLVEVHPRPEEALCDGAQALTPADFGQLLARARAVAQAVGRSLPSHAD